MGDWKELKPGKDYHGPDDSTVMLYITNFGRTDQNLASEVFYQFGSINKDRTEAQIQRMISEGKITEFYTGKVRWLKKVL